MKIYVDEVYKIYSYAIIIIYIYTTVYTSYADFKTGMVLLTYFKNKSIDSSGSCNIEYIHKFQYVYHTHTPEFLICLEAWAKLLQQWLVCVELICQLTKS